MRMQDRKTLIFMLLIPLLRARSQHMELLLMSRDNHSPSGPSVYCAVDITMQLLHTHDGAFSAHGVTACVLSIAIMRSNDACCVSTWRC
ncbi:hypothetical protein BXZ70DRAFT_281664 [Cristinia sonorae]|uniref:Secreted protein n=1 Tax=Cristinia sonorae TaxID=1940300 RepID=A0A8K0UXX0_9AGAR|nr:hypothetical protein BXZ70DRAFT_281664 [Cristinia sonorae]